MNRRLIPCNLAVAILSATSAVSFGQVANWINATSGSWSDASRWSTGVIPGSSSTAAIGAAGASYSVTVDSAVDVGALSLASPNATLDLAHPLTTRWFDYYAGRMTGQPMSLIGIGSTARLGLQGVGSFAPQPAAFDVRGTLQIVQIGTNTGLGWAVPAGMSVTQRAVAANPITSLTYPVNTISGYPAPMFTNAGTVRLYADTDTTTSSMLVGTAGTGFLNRGTFRIEGGSSQSNFRGINGHFWNDTGGLARFDSPTTIASSLTNLGSLNVGAETVVNGPVTQQAGTLDVTGGALITKDFTYTGGAIIGTPVLDGSSTLAALRLNGVYADLSPATFVARGSMMIQPATSTSAPADFLQASPSSSAPSQARQPAFPLTETPNRLAAQVSSTKALSAFRPSLPPQARR